MANDYLLIIDGSSLLSTQFYGNLPKEILYAKTEEEKSQFYHKIMQNSKGVYTNGVFGFVKVLLSILKQQKPKYLAVCWDVTRDTFRKELYSEYKGNRKATPEPLKEQFVLCQKLLEQMGVKQFMSSEYEADDYAGSLAERFKNELPVRIMTKDRDYLQLVDEQVNLWMVTSSKNKAMDYNKRYHLKAEETGAPDGTMFLTAELVYKEFGYPPEKTVMVKQLAGDTADNIPGVKGIGEKTAIALANAYPSIEAMYDEIRDLDKTGLDEIRKRWSAEYGIKRSPMKYLLADSDEEMVGEKASVISKKLATIRKDIDLGEISLSDLKLVLKGEAVKSQFRELEFHSLSLEHVEREYITEAESKAQEIAIVTVNDKNRADDLLKKACESSQVAVSVLAVARAHKKEEPKQMDLFSYFGTSDGIAAVDSKNDTNSEKNTADGSMVKEIECFSMSIKEGEAFIFSKDSFTMQELVFYLTKLYESSCQVISFDVKEQLHLMEENVARTLILREAREEMPAFDLGIAAYLIDPLKSVYMPAQISAEYGYEIMDRQQIIEKKGNLETIYAEGEIITKLLAQEAEAAFKLRSVLENVLERKEMVSLFYDVEMPTVFTLYEMEKNGIRVEKAALKQYGLQLGSSIEKLEKSIYQKAGKEFNIQSPKQLGVVLFEELGLPKGKKTKTGYSTSAEVLEGLRQEYPIVEEILEYRQLTKLRSTYAEGLEDYIREDGRIHGHFNQTVTATGRLSSTEPNLQNIPMRTELGRAIRKVFLPKEKAVFVDADYSQIELRILAHMSGDETLIQAFEDGQDIHALTASQVFQVPFSEVTPLMRRNAKAVNFGIVYGISAHGLSVDLGISRKMAADYMESYFATYPKIKEFLDGLVEEAQKEGMVRTEFGRIRPIPEIHSTNFNQRSFGERVAMNSPIQGTAADIMKIAMIRTDRALKKAKLRSRLVLQIHDELLLETEQDELEQVEQIVKDAMMNSCSMRVKLLIESKVGQNWYDAK